MSDRFVPIFRWSGQYCGFLAGGCLFDATGLYLGWEDAAGQVWKRDGTHMGQRVDEHYVLRREGFATPVPRPPRTQPVLPELPIAPANRAARSPMPGWGDALGGTGLRPLAEDLFGTWHNRHDRIDLGADRVYRLISGAEPPQTGNWDLRTNLMLRPSSTTGAKVQNLVFHIIEYDVASLCLRRITVNETSIAFTLRRMPDQDA